MLSVVYIIFAMAASLIENNCALMRHNIFPVRVSITGACSLCACADQVYLWYLLYTSVPIWARALWLCHPLTTICWTERNNTIVRTKQLSPGSKPAFLQPWTQHQLETGREGRYWTPWNTSPAATTTPRQKWERSGKPCWWTLRRTAQLVQRTTRLSCRYVSPCWWSIWWPRDATHATLGMVTWNRQTV